MDWTILPTPVAIAAVALLGYLFGRSSLRRAQADPNQMRRELKRAKQVVAELERIAQDVRRNLANHHSSVLHFKDRLAELGADADAAATRHMCHEAERLLTPTLRLVSQMATAYDQLRQQSSMLMSFTEVRTDALTGLSNRRAFDEALATLLAMQKRYKATFSVAIFDIDHFKKVNDELGHLHGDQILKQVAELLEVCVRETDIAARFGGEEFIVIMPETDLEGARILARRIQRMVEAETDVTLSGGITRAIAGDDDRSVVARADEALYAAKAAGRNGIYQHDGCEVAPIKAICALPNEESLASA
jgi:diguanylate cyclase (GGDEF)-like protein